MSDDSRERGVELGDLRNDLDSHDFPATKDALIDAYGDYEIELGDERVPFESLIDPLNQTDYQSVDEVEEAIMTMVGEDAIGRKNYSDRTPPALGEIRQDEGAPEEGGHMHQDSF